MRAAVLTVSDGVSAGVREDSSGDCLADLLAAEGYAVERRVVPDERDTIAAALRDLAGARPTLVLTTGGTGLAPRDVTPEATLDVVDRVAPGIAEALRSDAARRTPARAPLTRRRRPRRLDARDQPARLARRRAATASRCFARRSRTPSSSSRDEPTAHEQT